MAKKGTKTRKKYSCDFETTTDPNDCRVWAWAVCDIDNPKRTEVGNCIGTFMQWVSRLYGATLYFHNLKFDGEFILNWLIDNGFEHNEDSRYLKNKQYSTLISDKGIFYSMDIMLGTNHIQILDSLKIISLPVEDIPEAFGLPDSKLTIDYKLKRYPGHVLTQEETDYVTADVVIVAKALKIFLDQGLRKMTQGSCALEEYKAMIGKDAFKRWFPTPEYDKDIRQSYKGAFTYLKKGYSDKDVGKGLVLDVNSLYPYVMDSCALPYGNGIFFEGKYKYDKRHPLYIQMFRCAFKLKEGFLPTVQIKKNMQFVPTEYLEDSGGEVVALCMTCVDLEIFLKHYHVSEMEYLSGWMWRASKKMFKAYVAKWIEVKIKATKEKNKGLRQIAKLMLNSLYGKFAVNPKCRSKIPYKEDGVVHYRVGPEEERKALYIPVGSFITAWARHVTITAAQALYPRFIYSDTDSIHLLGWELPEGIEIDDAKLGAWKIETKFNRARFLRAKTYIEDTDKELKVTCAGLPKKAKEQVTWGNFHPKAEFTGKLQPAHVPGGIVLKDVGFKISA